jgi:trehalose 6-phosphate synthase
VQDYQLLLVGSELRARRPDLRIAQFVHTPFSRADELDLLPPDSRDDLMTALASAPTGFHTHHWEQAARSCLAATGGHSDQLFTATFGPDPEDLARVAASSETAAASAELERRVDGLAVVVRADRVELSKNILLGFDAFDRFLDAHPEWRGGVVFAAMVNPSRETIPAYRAYRDAIEAAVRRINDRWSTPGWSPILFDARDDFPRSVAALARADVLLVNPIRDGLNLVALEGPLVNRRDAAVCLSTEAGAYEYLQDAVIGVDPEDVAATAEAIHTALTMSPARRADRARRLRAQAVAHPADAWLAELVSHAR